MRPNRCQIDIYWSGYSAQGLAFLVVSLENYGPSCSPEPSNRKIPHSMQSVLDNIIITITAKIKSRFMSYADRAVHNTCDAILHGLCTAQQLLHSKASASDQYGRKLRLYKVTCRNILKVVRTLSNMLKTNSNTHTQ
eukprot:4836736-Amphidinium_carterae.1